MIETNKNHIPLIPPYILKESTWYGTTVKSFKILDGVILQSPHPQRIMKQSSCSSIISTDARN